MRPGEASPSISQVIKRHLHAKGRREKVLPLRVRAGQALHCLQREETGGKRHLLLCGIHSTPGKAVVAVAGGVPVLWWPATGENRQEGRSLSSYPLCLLPIMCGVGGVDGGDRYVCVCVQCDIRPSCLLYYVCLSVHPCCV